MHYALTLHKHQAAARTKHEQTALQRQIDGLVYELGVYPGEPRRASA